MELFTVTPRAERGGCSLRVHVLHLNGWRGDGEAEVFVGNWEVSHSDWFVLDFIGCHCLVLVEVEWALNHSFWGLLGRLVAAWGSRVRVLVGIVGVRLVLKLARTSASARNASSPSTTASTPAASSRGEALGLLSRHRCCHCQWVRVVFPHVFH